MSRLQEYLTENSSKNAKILAKARKELDFLKKSKKMGKITKAGQAKLDRLTAEFYKLGIFDV
jgi:hypothetical protein